MHVVEPTCFPEFQQATGAWTQLKGGCDAWYFIVNSTELGNTKVAHEILIV